MQNTSAMLPLQSRRLVLRRLEITDRDVFLAYRNDPNVSRYQGWEAVSVAEATAFIDSQQSHEPAVPGQWRQIAIALKETNLLVGDCGLKVHAENGQQATIGITLSHSHQGSGLATEALSTLLDHLFLNMKLHRVIADTDPRNAAAWRLLERLGMRREAHLSRSLWFKGEWADEYVYAILGDEWVQR